MGASVVLVRAVMPPAALYGGEFVLGSVQVLEQLEAEAKEYLESVAKGISGRGLNVGIYVAVGMPAEVILSAAQEGGSAAVAMTTHGRSGIGRWVFGSVTDAVVRHGDVPVFVIRTRPNTPEDEIEGIPVAGNAVVPPPALMETGQPVAAEKARPTEPRRHRPERSPGR
jgi:nucleotide-binding universal stress UspA family protein